jgi:DMSO/TMAO reductase YedYZ molybdopterin-dependent catalytic subunit
MAPSHLSRRKFLGASGAAASTLALAGCNQFDFLGGRQHPVRDVLEGANALTYNAQRLVIGRDALAREFSASEIRQGQRPNGSRNPSSAEYRAVRDTSFSTYRLKVTGLVERELSLSLSELQAMPARTQITRHDCVEGWSCIAKWTGVPLSAVLDRAVVKSEARFVVFRCLDTIQKSLSGDIKYYESIDLVDARHPQTILAYGMNGDPLPVSNGAPLRLRVERQLGYKMAKYIHAIELVDSLQPIGAGGGGYWEDRGYEWYAGI